MNMRFRKFNGAEILDVARYIRQYRYERPNETVQLMIGTDSQKRGEKTAISTVIVLYTVGKGGHIIHWTTDYPVFADLFSKLWKEVEHTAHVVSYLLEAGFKRDDMLIHIDVNPNPRWDSHVAFKASVGFFKGMGFEDDHVITKPLSYVAMHVADHAVRMPQAA